MTLFDKDAPFTYVPPNYKPSVTDPVNDYLEGRGYHPEQDPRIFAISGTHGTGKTTSVFELAKTLKMEHHDKTVGIVQELAGTAPFPINKDATEDTQLWIFSAQIAYELHAASVYDMAVSDRTIVDCMAYTRVLGFNTLAEAMMRMAQHHIKAYKKIYVKTASNNSFVFADLTRETEDFQFRQDVEDCLLELYQELGAKPVVL